MCGCARDGGTTDDLSGIAETAIAAPAGGGVRPLGGRFLTGASRADRWQPSEALLRLVLVSTMTIDTTTAPSAPSTILHGTFWQLPCERSPELWFAEHARDLGLAKAGCAPCPRRAECLTGALERREPAGVWGGEVLADGVVVAHKRGRGRPPRDHGARHA